MLKIGYLLEGSDLDPARSLMEALRQALLANPDLRAAMKDAGYAEIVPKVCYGPADMIQRLRAEEFELAFATAIIYASQFVGGGAGLPTARYEPIFQFRLAGDAYNPSQVGVYRFARVFIGPSSSLWNVSDPDETQIRREIEREEMAVSNAYSAGSYIYPQIEIQKRFKGLKLRNPLFCGSSSEVVKHVVSGLVAIGACETSVLEKYGAAQAPLAKPLFETQRIPTDPIILQTDLLPGKSALGRELKTALRSFFKSSAARAAGLSIEATNRRAYEELGKALMEFDPSQITMPEALLRRRTAPPEPALHQALPPDPGSIPSAPRQSP